jgi:putative peptidoglycan lipid II flippase
VSVVTVVSLPIYGFLFHTFGVIGLAWASDIGIGMNLVVLAWLLHRRKFVPLGGLRWGELGKAVVTAVVAGGISFEVAKIVPLVSSSISSSSRVADLVQLALVSVTWAAAVAAGLWLLRSELPRDLRRRKGAVYPGVAQGEAKEILGSGREP